VFTGLLQRACACGQHTSDGSGECEECKKKREGTLQRAAIAPAPDLAPPIVHDVLRSPGQPLNAETRTYMEPRFGHDFSHVRVHSDGRAAESAKSVNALAYTVGNHVAFGAGQYRPQSNDGRRLLAHELAHVVQQSGMPAAVQPSTLSVATTSSPSEHEAENAARTVEAGSAAPQLTPVAATSIQRHWDTPTATECTDINPDVWLKKVVVEQEMPQHVTLHWSDGTLEAGICSTGKGHCCVDPASPDGVGCSTAESRRDGSNCTPITSNERITDRYREYNTWHFWNTFVPSRGIALHQHHTVSGAPLSHGCVRLHEDTARHIFCGARQNVTRVEVRGFARPFCSDPQLVDEWRNEFASAARSTDGEPPDRARVIRQNRRESRRILNEAYGRTLSEAEISGGLNGLDIPTCSATQAEPNREERRRLPETGAASNVPTVPAQILATSGFERFIPQLSNALATAGSFRQARRSVADQGRALWQASTARAQAATPDSDDRPLYWARLDMTRIVRQWQPRFGISNAQRTELIQLLEQTSRGMDTVRFDRNPRTKRILISGFDPFGLDIGPGQDIRHGNPSGAAAISLDGRRLTNGAVTAEVQAVVFPVRFADFDAGIVESFFRPFLSGPNAVDMIMTISQGGSADFEVEEFAGRRRATTFEDNLGVSGGGSPTNPVEPPGLAAGPEFLRTSLPASARRSLGRTSPSPGEREITEIPAGSTRSTHRPTGPTAGSTAVAGSGGSFLSNEIFYRTSLLRSQTGATIPVGHLHTPELKPPGGDRITSSTFEQERDDIVQRIEQILQATLPDL
jgi:pyrrolidone-carboxylate peptidase